MYIENNNRSRLFLFLGIASLIMLTAETLVMSLPLWFVNLWGWTMTAPLYLSHFLFLYTISVNTKKTDFKHLYFLGVIFGLYESWITKVMWSGYVNQPPMLGMFLGVAIFEFITLAFFFHPFYSFILPLIIYELIIYSKTGDENKILPGHINFIKKIKKNYALALFFVIWPLSISASYNGINTIITILGSLILITLFFWLDSRHNTPDIYRLKLGKKGMRITGIYLFLLYILSFPLLRSEYIPVNPISYITIIMMYIITIIAWKKSKSLEMENSNIKDVFTIKFLLLLIVIAIIASIVFIVINPIGLYIFLVINYVVLLIGPLMYIKMAIWK